jgi:glycine cleavage system H protein
MENPSDRKYTESHEWIRDNGDGTATVGITFHAQDALGELVYVELPETGRQVSAGEACVVVESTKAASDVYAPVDGEVIETNDTLVDAPQNVNESPYEAGWLFKIRVADGSALEKMMSSADYSAGPGSA